MCCMSCAEGHRVLLQRPSRDKDSTSLLGESRHDTSHTSSLMINFNIKCIYFESFDPPWEHERPGCVTSALVYKLFTLLITWFHQQLLGDVCAEKRGCRASKWKNSAENTWNVNVALKNPQLDRYLICFDWKATGGWTAGCYGDVHHPCKQVQSIGRARKTCLKLFLLLCREPGPKPGRSQAALDAPPPQAPAGGRGRR